MSIAEWVIVGSGAISLVTLGACIGVLLERYGQRR